MNRELRLVLGLALLGLTAHCAAAAPSESPLNIGDPSQSSPGPSVQTFLDAEGRIDVEALRQSGYDGPLDMKGLCTRLNPRTGALIAAPQSPQQARMPGDEYWAPGFGSPDPIPGVDGEYGPHVRCMAVYEGELIVGGSFTQAGGVDVGNIARWDGTSWLSMPNPGLPSLVSCAAVYQGDLVVGGYGIRRWNGISWENLGSYYFDNSVYALVVHDGGLYVGGNFLTAGGIMAPRIARWDGEVWSPVGPGFDGTVRALGVYNGELIAAGEFSRSGNTEVNHIARWNGLNWVPLGSGIDGDVSAVLQYGGGLIAGGDFTMAGGDSVNSIARWNGVEWDALPGAQSSWWASIKTLGEYSGRLVVGGYFGEWNGQPANNIVEWDGTNWWVMDSGMNSDVNCLAVYNNQLHAGGYFTEASGAEVLRVARWDGGTWSALWEAPGAGLDGVVYALAAYQGNLVAGGWFYTAGPTPVNNVALWNGSGWIPLGEGLNNYVLALAVRGTELLAGGGFNASGGQEANYVARWDGSSWHPLGDGMNTVVNALTICQGDVYAGGHFTRADGLLVNHVAHWDGNQWGGLGSGTDGVVNALLEFEGELIAAGDFYNAGGTYARSVARWDGSSWEAFDEGIDYPLYSLVIYQGELVAGGNYTIRRWTGWGWEYLGYLSNVSALAVHNEWLVAGGYFAIGPEPSSYNISRWNGVTWGSLGSGTNSTVEALAISGTDLFVGGAFTNAGSKAAIHLARWTDPAIACRLEFLEPTAADTLTVGEQVEIAWTPTGGCSPEVRIDLLAYGYECQSITEQTENDGSFTWTVSSCFDYPHAHNIRITELPQGTYARSDSIMILPRACAGEGYWSGLFDPAGLDGPVLALLEGPEPGEVIAGGAFTQGGGVALNHVGLWDGQAWHPLGTGLEGSVRALAWWQGSLFAGGDFVETGSGSEVNHVARWDGNTWVPLEAGFDGPVYALVDQQEDYLVAGGDFLQSGGTTVNYIARWNGANWGSLGSGMDGPVLSLVFGNLWRESLLVAGGLFDEAGGFEVNHVAQYWDEYWQPLGAGFNGSVEALALVLQGYLIAGGEFTESGADTVAHVAYWVGDGWEALGSGTNGPVHSLCWSGDYLYAGGSFDQAGEMDTHQIAGFDGQHWCPLASGTNGVVRALAGVPVGPDSSYLYVGGDFTAAGDRPSGFIGRWRSILPTCGIDLLQPAGGENLETGSQAEIQWSYGDSCGTLVRIELLSSGAYCATISEMTENDGSYSWTVSPCGGYPQDGYTLRVVDLDTGEWGESGAFVITGGMSALPGPVAAQLPARTVLFPCRPNPSSAEVGLTFDLAQTADLRLQVFDATGRCVALLARSQHPPGRYRIQWSGRDQEGNVLPSGVYLCQMKANEVTQTRKVLLTR